jgi:AcrR family transcriptional regulator
MPSVERARKPLTEERIVVAALDIADGDGIEALSMRTLAKRLRCNPMSLYEHIANKEALLDLMADRALASLPALDPDGAWRGELLRFFLAYHDLFVKHPAVAHVAVQRPLAGEMAIKRGDRALETLVRAGFSDEQAVAVFITLANYTIGASLYQRARRAPALQRFDTLQEGEHPTVYRLREKIAHASDDTEFRAALTHIVNSFTPDTG